MQPDLNDGIKPDAESASESTVGTDGDKIMLTTKGMKKMERALAPTSEQLASLNLKEGKNTVTFTFSTAMLGNQEVVFVVIYSWVSLRLKVFIFHLIHFHLFVSFSDTLTVLSYHFCCSTG